MFGFVQPNTKDITDEEKARYTVLYCGICHSLGANHGFMRRLGLSYDMTFLALLLSSLYEPQETPHSGRCTAHPVAGRDYLQSSVIDYCRDMTVALAYHKSLDDRHDEGSFISAEYAKIIKSNYEKIKEKYPEQTAVIEKEMAEISAIEKDGDLSVDLAANSFGRLMAAVFVLKKDMWRQTLYDFGYNLGRFIYFADAARDLEKDEDSRSYNPLVNLSSDTDIRRILQVIMGQASRRFEILPMEKDLNLMRNIIYSGIWVELNRKQQKQENTNGN